MSGWMHDDVCVVVDYRRFVMAKIGDLSAEELELLFVCIDVAAATASQKAKRADNAEVRKVWERHEAVVRALKSKLQLTK